MLLVTILLSKTTISIVRRQSTKAADETAGASRVYHGWARQSGDNRYAIDGRRVKSMHRIGRAASNEQRVSEFDLIFDLS